MAPIRCCFNQTAVWHSDAARGPSTPSFNHLVGGHLHDHRHGEAERLRSLEVYGQQKLRRLQNRQFAWLSALENPADVAACLTIAVGQVNSVADQPARAYSVAPRVNRRYGVMGGECNQLIFSSGEKNIGGDDECLSALLHEG